VRPFSPIIHGVVFTRFFFSFSPPLQTMSPTPEPLKPIFRLRPAPARPVARAKTFVQIASTSRLTAYADNARQTSASLSSLPTSVSDAPIPQFKPTTASTTSGPHSYSQTSAYATTSPTFTPALYLYPLTGSATPRRIALTPGAHISLGRYTGVRPTQLPTSPRFACTALERRHAEVWAENGGIWLRAEDGEETFLRDGKEEGSVRVWHAWHKGVYELRPDDLIVSPASVSLYATLRVLTCRISGTGNGRHHRCHPSREGTPRCRPGAHFSRRSCPHTR
jgi:hypothetical protein